MSIDRFHELPGLPERYIEVKEGDGRWVCELELRDRFNLTVVNGHIITVFLSGLMYKAIAGFRFIVYRVKRIKAQYPQDPPCTW